MRKRKKAISPILIALILWTNIVCLSAAAQPAPYNPYNRYKGQSSPYKSQANSYKRQSSPYRSMPGRTIQQPLADDTIIMSLRSGADMDKVQEVLDDVNGTVIKTLHVNADNYDILLIKPEKGKEEETIKKITDEDKKDKNFKVISRNYRKYLLQPPPVSTSSGSR